VKTHEAAVSATQPPRPSAAPQDAFKEAMERITSWAKEQAAKAQGHVASTATQQVTPLAPQKEEVPASAERTNHRQPLGDFIRTLGEAAQAHPPSDEEKARRKEFWKALGVQWMPKASQASGSVQQTTTQAPWFMPKAHKAERKADGIQSAMEGIASWIKAQKEKADQAEPKPNAAKKAADTTDSAVEAVPVAKPSKADDRASIDSAVEEAERKLAAAVSAKKAVDALGHADTSEAKAKAATAEAVKREASKAAKEALEGLLSWAEMDSLQKTHAEPALKAARSVAEQADKQAKIAKWAADKAQRQATWAAASAERGHQESKAAWRAGGTGATGKALAGAVDAQGFARTAARGASEAARHLADTQSYASQTVEALRSAGEDLVASPASRGEAMKALDKASKAVERATRESLEAGLHAREAAESVARAISEAGWRAVSEILRSEFSLLREVIAKSSQLDSPKQLEAWSQGFAKAKNVAQVAWYKGLAQGLQKPVTAEAIGKLGKASSDMTDLGIHWAKAVSKALQTKEWQAQVVKAISTATRNAGAAAIIAAQDLRAKAAEQKARKRLLSRGSSAAKTIRFLLPGSSATAFGSITKDKGFEANTIGSFGRLYGFGHADAVQNQSHWTLHAAGRIAKPLRGHAAGSVNASVGKESSPSAGQSDVEASAHVKMPRTPSAQMTRAHATHHAHPTDKGLFFEDSGTLGVLDHHLQGKVTGLMGKDGKVMGKASGEYWSPQLSKPLQGSTYFAQPLPRSSQAALRGAARAA